MSDQVPVDQRRVVSSWVSAPRAIGTIVGIAILSVLALGFLAGYTVLEVLLIVLVAPFLWFVDDPAPAHHDRVRLTARHLLSELWISPREQPDFGWTLLGRILV